MKNAQDYRVCRSCREIIPPRFAGDFPTVCPVHGEGSMVEVGDLLDEAEVGRRQIASIEEAVDAYG
jgi:hypothetical protein